ncbi:MAG TPA: PD-(D/E)XK nuclease family protein [Albitalea sp.]|nr:PD-(D/E)XK nuclease family protein [Albitalea sp.]
MASIARFPLEIHAGDPWPGLVRHALAWAGERSVNLRDTIVLLPFAQLLAPARREWARAGGWLPRIETTQTLARSLGPAELPAAGQISFDVALDRLTARSLLLRSQGWAAAWLRRDPRGFEHAVAALVVTAHAFARAAAAVAPVGRDAYWRGGRATLAAQTGPGATERALARVAFEWAAAMATPPTDALFGLRPAAWIVVQAGGADPLSMALLQAAPSAAERLLIDTDVSLDEPFAGIALEAEVSLAVCDDFEAEAQRTAAQVLAHLADAADAAQPATPRSPVALIAQDRVLTRRVRALLARHGVALLDETGWKLSTTRAGATVASLLRAARQGATSDDWLDWLKTSAGQWPGIASGPFAVQLLEAALRRHGWVTPRAVDAASLGELPGALWSSATAIVAELSASRTRSLTGWLQALRAALQDCGAWTSLAADDAGRQVLAALHLLATLNEQALSAGHETLGFDDFSQWVDAVLEEGSFRPEAQAGAQVIVTPLERTVLRPFSAAVLAGADEKRLGVGAAPQGLLGDALAAELGLPTSALRRDAQTLAFAQLLRIPSVTLLRRLDDGGEPLAASPLVERLELALARCGRALSPASNPGRSIAIVPAPVHRPLPTAAALLPDRLSASACEALRSCPYRFFALRLLRLREAEELDDELEKRDYGTWLHAVLHRFHATRDQPLPAAAEAERLHTIAREIRQSLRFDEAAFLPFAASFARFVPRYVQWLHGRDRQGAQWLDGEVELTARPAAWAGVEMHGVIDRVDSVPAAEGPLTQLIDYKTGSGDRLRELVKQPLEDTQLAFYAALMAQQSQVGGDIAALYLPLDDSGEIREVVHPEVEQTARQLVHEVGAELARLRDGAALPALGEGRVCDFCEARGLCRRDHWSNEDLA